MQQPSLDGDHDWLNETSIASLQRTLRHLDTSYKTFFRGNAQFPAFKSKRGKQVFTLSGRVKVSAKRLCIPKFQEGLKFNRDIPAFTKINNLTVHRAPSGAFYAALSVEADRVPLLPTSNEAGIDVGLIDFAVLSTGKRIKNPRHLQIHEKALRRSQQHLSRKQKGSKRREKQRIKVARLHERIANARKDFHHKTSAYVVRSFGIIAVEHLAVKNMVRNSSLAKHISDAGWSRFLRMVHYKSQWYGRTLVQVDRFYPSSKTCGDCGYINQSLMLNQRTWQCGSCDAQHDRDVNAARNILAESRRISRRQSSITGSEAA